MGFSLNGFMILGWFNLEWFLILGWFDLEWFANMMVVGSERDREAMKKIIKNGKKNKYFIRIKVYDRQTDVGIL